jgi:lysophospholipase L1-like esterase
MNIIVKNKVINFSKNYLAVTCVLLCVSMNLSANNLLKHGGFEKKSNWSTRDYWGGSLSRLQTPGQAHRGKACMRLEVKADDKKHTGKAISNFENGIVAGRKFIFSLWAKGKGTARMGIFKHYGTESGKKTSLISLKKEVLNLNNKWSQYNYNIDLSQDAPYRISLLIELCEPGEIFFDDVKLVPCVPQIKIKPFVNYEIIEQGGKLPSMKFKCSKPQTEVTVFRTISQYAFKQQKLISDVQGIVISPAPKSKTVSKGRIITRAAVDGAFADVFTDFMSINLYTKFKKLAEKIKLNKNLHVLYIGDSLSDLDRGCNYINKINFWLNKYNPGKVSFCNAGVRGDYITRVKNRLENKKTYNPHAYHNMLKVQPDIIFIFLGQNDTRTKSLDNFKQPLVPANEQENAYRFVLKWLRNKTNARIILISAASLYEPVCTAKAKLYLKKYGKAVRFGEPDKLEKFNEILKKLASEFKLGYIDIYSPMKKSPDKKDFFKADGVHVNDAGNNYIALKIMEYLAANHNK